MTPERWREVGDLFARALAEPEDTRRAWLEAVESPDDVKREVVALLDAHQSSDDFLEAPAAELTTTSGPSHAGVSLPGIGPGDVLGAYQIVRVIGSGGMGVVFEAEDTRLHRRVALKAVWTEPGREVDEHRLRQEARAAAALMHPNIATVYALEDIDGHAYIASEYLEGETLRDTIARGPLARAEMLAVARALASALVAAHARGIVHRDLKPENVLRLADGRVKVLDFGLARLEGEARQLASVSRLTLHGVVAGTPGYMAPEQLLGHEIDSRVDQFAFGALVAELATGSNPFEAGTLTATIARVLASDGLPPRKQGDRPIDADIESIVSTCLRRDPDDRYPSTADLEAAIAACQRGDSLAVPELRVGRRDTPRMPPDVPRDPSTGRRPPMWWWRFHQAASAAVNWMMVVPAWLVHRDVPPGLPWFLACLAATIVTANVRLHLRFSAVVLPHELHAQRQKTRGWVAVADWALIVLWAYAGFELLATSREWAVVFFAFAVGTAVVVALIEPATTRAAFAEP